MIRVDLERVDSTNTEIRRMLAEGAVGDEMLVVSASDQYSGRGQKGHTWESEAGKNLSFSLLCHPRSIRPSEQFIMSQAISLSVVDVLKEISRKESETSVSPLNLLDYSVKWPNDIYYGKSKICGILIECDIQGKILDNCIIGVGINVNQESFGDYIPPAISLRGIYGHEFDTNMLMEQVLSRFEHYYNMVRTGNFAPIRTMYHSVLYRREGVHHYSDSSGEFDATFSSIEPDGHLVLSDTSSRLRRYAFKEVKFLG